MENIQKEVPVLEENIHTELSVQEENILVIYFLYKTRHF
jgi:hypothetical protein